MGRGSQTLWEQHGLEGGSGVCGADREIWGRRAGGLLAEWLRKRSGQRLASCSVKGQAVNILEPVGPTRTLVTTQLLFVRSGQLSTVHK